MNRNQGDPPAAGKGILQYGPLEYPGKRRREATRLARGAAAEDEQEKEIS